MKIKQKTKCDVLVIGSGLAGIMSAITASENGADVILISKDKFASGSSFCNETWGLGLVTPLNDDDAEDMAQTIVRVGQSMADKELVSELVYGIRPAVLKLEGLGVALKKSINKNQKDFIPCFDYKHRGWNGIIASNAKDVFNKQIKSLGITVIEKTELIDLHISDSHADGALLYNSDDGIFLIGCKSVVLACGGYSTLFKDYVTTDDVTASMHSFALNHGCRLINLEYLQMMSAYVYPCYKTIFNERVFRYIDLISDIGTSLITNEKAERDLLETRSAYGPFTSEKPSKEIDFTISKYQNPDGVRIKYRKEIKDNQSEFAKEYFDWLLKCKHLTIDDEPYISIFAHASNGGIYIDKNAWTGITGLYACGEITGGMHGADRIGGLSSANCLVFGINAGKSASLNAKKTDYSPAEKMEINLFGFYNSKESDLQLRQLMSKNCMVIRNEAGLLKTIEKITELKSKNKFYDNSTVEDFVVGKRLEARLQLAECIARSQLLRKESRGSHYRSDYTCHNDKMNKSIIVSKLNGSVNVEFNR